MNRQITRSSFLGCLLMTALIAGLAAPGCRSGGGDPPPADVEGVWEGEIVNGDAAILTCTGDLSVLDGRTFAEVIAGSPDCGENSIQVRQDGTHFTLISKQVTCDRGEVLTAEGGGTVSGNRLEGQFESSLRVSGIFRVESFTASVRGRRIDLFEDRISVSDSEQGECEISPAVHSQIEILPLSS